MARKNTTPVEVLTQTQQNRNKVLEMRLAGMSQQEIARKTGWSKQRVSTYIRDAIADITRENAEEYLALELSRLDALQAALWKEATSGKQWSEQKVDRVIAIIDQRARLLGSYKHAELKAIADAKGNVAEDANSMVASLVAAFDTYAKGKALEEAEADAESESSDDDEQGAAE